MSDNLKWLLLIPVVIVAISLGYVIPKLFGSGEGDVPDKQRNQALELDIADTEQRIASYQDLIASNPADADALRGIGENYRELGTLQSQNDQVNEAFVSYKSAVDYYRKYLAANPAGQETRIDMGLTYFYMQMPDVAERELIVVTQALPLNQRAWHSLGWVQANGLGKEQEALVSWQRSYEIDPASVIGKESKSFMDQLSTPIADNEITVPPAP